MNTNGHLRKLHGDQESLIKSKQMCVISCNGDKCIACGVCLVLEDDSTIMTQRELSTLSSACWSPVPGLLQPLVEGIGMLGKLLSEFIILFLSPLLLL